MVSTVLSGSRVRGVRAIKGKNRQGQERARARKGKVEQGPVRHGQAQVRRRLPRSDCQCLPWHFNDWPCDAIGFAMALN